MVGHQALPKGAASETISAAASESIQWPLRRHRRGQNGSSKIGRRAKSADICGPQMGPGREIAGATDIGSTLHQLRQSVAFERQFQSDSRTRLRQLREEERTTSPETLAHKRRAKELRALASANEILGAEVAALKKAQAEAEAKCTQKAVRCANLDQEVTNLRNKNRSLELSMVRYRDVAARAEKRLRQQLHDSTAQNQQEEDQSMAAREVEIARRHAQDRMNWDVERTQYRTRNDTLALQLSNAKIELRHIEASKSEMQQQVQRLATQLAEETPEKQKRLQTQDSVPTSTRIQDSKDTGKAVDHMAERIRRQEEIDAVVRTAQEAAQSKYSLQLAAVHAAHQTAQAQSDVQISSLQHELSDAKQKRRKRARQDQVESVWQEKLVEKVMSQAALKIQSSFRGHRARVSLQEQLALKHAAAKEERIEAEEILYRHRVDEDKEAMSPTCRLPIINSPQCEEEKKVKVKRIPTGSVLAKLKFIQSRYYNSYEAHIL